MNILGLIKNDEKDKFIIDYLNQNFTHESNQIHLLNIVAVSGEIPTKANGEVLDVCSEFDLSEYLRTSKENLDYLNELNLEKATARFSLVGSPIEVVKNYIAKNDIDLIIAGANATTLLNDVFMKTFTSRIIENIDIPFLSIKCHRGDMPLKQVAIVKTFEDPEKENLVVLKQIIEEANAEVTLIKVELSEESDEKILSDMDRYKELNGLNAESRIIHAKNLENTLEDLMLNEDIDLIVLGKRNGFQIALMNGTNKSIVNHVYAPILIN